MSKYIKIVAVLALTLATTTSMAGAQSNSDEWQFQLAPLYLWAVNIDGNMNVRGLGENDFNVNFNDAFSNLEMVFTIHFEARKGRWGILADASYLDLAGSQDIHTPGETAEINIENLILEGAVGYEFTDYWWAVAGVRYFKMDPEITTEFGPSLNPSDSWTDLFAGLLWRPELNDRWKFSGRFDIGAGGSDLVWNAAALFDYRLGKSTAVTFGYRHLDYDYKNQNSGIATDFSMSGPVAALRFFW